MNFQAEAICLFSMSKNETETKSIITFDLCLNTS